MNETLINILLFFILILHLLVIFLSNINNIIFLVFSIFVLTSAVFALMGLKFLAILYLIIYAGAIIILFIIAVKTININEKIKLLKSSKLPSIILSSFLGGVLLYLLFKTTKPIGIYYAVSYITLTDMMFNKNLIVIEIISLMLIAAIVGVINFLKKEQ